MTTPSQAVILCEGYEDRGFWAGWLEQLGCKDLSEKGRVPVIRDPWGKPVAGGAYAYESPSGGFLRVVPCRGDRSRIMARARLELSGRTTNPLRHLVINWDPDTRADAMEANPLADARRAIETALTHLNAAFTLNGDEDFLLDGGTTVVSPVAWMVPPPTPEGAPMQQALERLACMSLCAAFPDRGRAVHDWLTKRPAPSAKKEHKAYARSFMAGWYADHGCDDFYRLLWRDSTVAAHLNALLTQSGALRVAEALAR
jgi:hypothetical protein